MPTTVMNTSSQRSMRLHSLSCGPESGQGASQRHSEQDEQNEDDGDEPDHPNLRRESLTDWLVRDDGRLVQWLARGYLEQRFFEWGGQSGLGRNRGRKAWKEIVGD